MKIIDLLNKIANGENLPKRIKVDGYVYEWCTIEHYYSDEDGRDLLEVLSTTCETRHLLEKEVELIEDQTIDIVDIDSIEEIDTTKTFDYTMTDVFEWNNEMEEKINQTIRALKHLNKEIQSIKEK